MKNLILITATMLFSSFITKAQTSDPELDYIKAAYSKEKKEIVDQYMALNVQDGGKFWAIYGAYEKAREKLAIERLKAVQEYVEQGDQLSPEVADKIATATLNNTINLAKLNLDYYGKMKKDLGAIKAAKFMQLETYLQTAWRAVVQENIQLIGELDKTQMK